MKLNAEQRATTKMHTTVAPSSLTHDAYVFQDKAHRKGQITGEVYINRSLISERGKLVSVELIFEKE